MFYARIVLTALALTLFLPRAVQAQAQPQTQPVPQTQEVQPQAQVEELQPRLIQPQGVFPQAQQQMQAQDYAEPTFMNLVRTMIRFGALDLSDENMVDDYVLITECPIYSEFFKNDFKWNQVRKAARKSVQLNIATFPVAFRFDTAISMGRYDFNAKLFRFAQKSIIDGVNMITFYPSHETCPPHHAAYLPYVFHARLTSPIFIEGIPLSDVDAKGLIARMNELSSSKRHVYVRYNLRVVLIEPLVKVEVKARNRFAKYIQNEALGMREVNFNTRLDSIEFYEDRERKKLITIIRP